MDPIDEFLSCRRIAVVGASKDPEKYGNKVLVDLLAHGYDAIPVNQREAEREGRKFVAQVSELPDGVCSLSLIPPPRFNQQTA